MRNKARDVFFSLSLELIDLWPNAVARVQTRIGRLPTDGLPLLLCRLFFYLLLSHWKIWPWQNRLCMKDALLTTYCRDRRALIQIYNFYLELWGTVEFVVWWNLSQSSRINTFGHIIYFSFRVEYINTIWESGTRAPKCVCVLSSKRWISWNLGIGSEIRRKTGQA